MYSCENCKKLRNGLKEVSILHLPEVMCIHLKRFRHDLMHSSKIGSHVSFPITGLDVSPYIKHGQSIQSSRAVISQSFLVYFFIIQPPVPLVTVYCILTLAALSIVLLNNMLIMSLYTDTCYSYHCLF